MRMALERWAAAGVPLTLCTLFAVTACAGPDEADAKSPSADRSLSAIDESSRDSIDGRDYGEVPSRDSGSRGAGAIGETAGPGGQGPYGAHVAAAWPANDVTGTIPRARPGAGVGASGTGRDGAALLTYDATAADGFTGAVRAAAESWNDSVPEVELRPAPAGTEADIRVIVTKGWPGAEPQGPALGKGTVTIGRRALAQGHDAIRVVAHEFGHLLGLKVSQPGPCASLMSGKSAGASCTNSSPSTAEIREVRRNFS